MFRSRARVFAKQRRRLDRFRFASEVPGDIHQSFTPAPPQTSAADTYTLGRGLSAPLLEAAARPLRAKRDLQSSMTPFGKEVS